MGSNIESIWALPSFLVLTLFDLDPSAWLKSEHFSCCSAVSFFSWDAFFDDLKVQCWSVGVPLLNILVKLQRKHLVQMREGLTSNSELSPGYVLYVRCMVWWMVCVYVSEREIKLPAHVSPPPVFITSAVRLVSLLPFLQQVGASLFPCDNVELT